MDQLLTKLNNINRLNTANLVSIAKLTLNEKFKISRLEKRNTKYGTAVMAFIVQKETLWKLFLPKQFASTFDDEFINKFNGNEVGELYMTYKGPTEKSFSVVFS